MKLKEIILGILEQRRASFRDLAHYLNLREKDLQQALDMDPPEMRLLESIAKLLQVPLYSLLPTSLDPSHDLAERPDPECEVRPPLLEQEIQTLRRMLIEKEGMLKKLKS